ncbi:MAG TPA: hypothetical protein VK137_05750 [Planctomycetaceae bacterium]|nr:hypothetical protein [Planctomycetaceae bacterium]
MSDDIDLVTVATFPTVGEAQVAQMLLEEEGLTAVVADADLEHGLAVAYPELQVPPSSVERARQILQDLEEKHRQRSLNPTKPEPETCLECGAALEAESTVCPKCGWSFLPVVEGQPSPDEEPIE